MTSRIDYKAQLLRLKEILDEFFADKVLGNTFTEYDKGHRKASVELSKDMMNLVEMALRGKL